MRSLLWPAGSGVSQYNRPRSRSFGSAQRPWRSLMSESLTGPARLHARIRLSCLVNGQIDAVGKAAEVSIPRGAEVLELPGHTVIPGLVGMHEHLFYPTGGACRSTEHAFSFPRCIWRAALPLLAPRAVWKCRPI